MTNIHYRMPSSRKIFQNKEPQSNNRQIYLLDVEESFFGDAYFLYLPINSGDVWNLVVLQVLAFWLYKISFGNKKNIRTANENYFISMKKSVSHVSSSTLFVCLFKAESSSRSNFQKRVISSFIAWIQMVGW